MIVIPDALPAQMAASLSRQAAAYGAASVVRKELNLQASLWKSMVPKVDTITPRVSTLEVQMSNLQAEAVIV